MGAVRKGQNISPRTIYAAELRSDPLRALAGWYESARDGKNWPKVSDFRIARVPRECMAHIARVDITPDPFRVFYRAAGEYLCEARGMDFSQKYLDELPIPQKDDLTNWLQRALHLRGPFYVAHDQNVDGIAFHYETCVLPLGTPDDTPRAFLIAEAAQELEAWRHAVRHRHYGASPPPQMDHS